MISCKETASRSLWHPPSLSQHPWRNHELTKQLRYCFNLRRRFEWEIYPSRALVWSRRSARALSIRMIFFTPGLYRYEFFNPSLFVPYLKMACQKWNQHPRARADGNSNATAPRIAISKSEITTSGDGSLPTSRAVTSLIALSTFWYKSCVLLVIRQ